MIQNTCLSDHKNKEKLTSPFRSNKCSKSLGVKKLEIDFFGFNWEILDPLGAILDSSRDQSRFFYFLQIKEIYHISFMKREKIEYVTSN